MSSVTTTITSPQRHQQKKREINLTDDPDKLLNEWLGELENLIGVSFKWKNFIFFISLEFFFFMWKLIFFKFNNENTMKNTSGIIFKSNY